MRGYFSRLWWKQNSIFFFRAIVSRYTRACKAVFQRENRSARKPLTKRLNFNRNNGLILMEQKCSFFRTRIYHWPQTFILMVYKITRSVLYSITSEQSRRFIDWKIRREREKFFDRDSLREIYLGGKLENVTREEENCTGVKYYPGILARTTEQFTCTSLQLGEVTNTPPKLSV